METVPFFGIVFALHVIAALSFLLAVFFAVRLYRETDRGWYWLSLVLSAIVFAIPQWMKFVFPPIFPRGFMPLNPVIEEASGILGSLLFTLSCWGMYKTMKHIRKRVE